MARPRTWSPLDRPQPRTFTLETFARHGAHATVTMRGWAARQRIAFRDRITTELMALDVAGDRTILLGVMESRLVTSVIESWDGDWPEVIERELTEVERRRAPRGAKVAGLVTEPFDLRRLEHLGELGDPDVYDELVRLARSIEPNPLGMPGAGERGELTAAADDESDDEPDVDDEDDEDVVEDPPARRRSTRSRTPLTPVVVSGEVVDDALATARGRRTSANASRSRPSSTPRGSR